MNTSYIGASCVPPADPPPAPRRCSPKVLSAVFAVLLPSCFLISATALLRDDYGCYSQICPEKRQTSEARQSILFFYAWLALVALGLAVAQRTQWGNGHSFKHRHITLWPFGRVTFAELLVWTVVAVHQVLQFRIWYNALHARAMSKPDPRMLLVVLQSCYKAIGIPIGIQLSLTLLPTSRGGFLSSIFGIGYDHSLGFHRLSGILTVLLAIAHFAFFMAFSVVRGGWAPFWRVTLMIKATPQAFASYKGWHGPTGLVSLLLFVWVFCNSSEGTRRRSYCWFMINHFSVLGAILLAFVHASPIVWFCFPTLSFYIVDSCARVYNRRRPHAITRMSVEECGYIRLDIGDCHTTARPGQWVALNVPSISGIEWHPFTVAHSTSTAAGAAAKLRSKPEESQYLLESPLLPSSIEHPTAPRGLSLIIRPAFADASWTQKLLTAWTKLQAEDVEAGGVRTLAVHVDGPHGTLPPRFLRSDTILIIVGGSGIPGALAIARAVLDANPATGPKRLILHWTCRSPGAGEMTLWRELLAHPRASQLLESHVCVTTGKKHSPRLSVPSILRSLCDEHPSAPLPCRNVSIYGCGPEELMSDIRRHVSRFGDVVGDGFETTLEGPYAEVEARATTVDPGRDEPWVDREPSSASSTLSAPEVERVRSSRTRSSSPSPSRNLKIKFLLHVEGYGR